ncbi:putative aminohydrolase SsnA [Halanaerobium hydrogeniformans]|uniref:Selenium metabolism protein SsnA n=1 Tax=Halanaerobium hydrogeniformans TaxID=656519 RepID=E4RJV1_HALHG|nr:putative aminohydrolase SsnA [Halanaerobium hydrogeniformans]ADQ15521.1 selenium metabolism protein SsnA [Halanaerobium hydrogeniformans]
MLLLTNAVVITNDQDNRVIKDGAVLIEGSKIKEIAESDILESKYSEVEVKDVDGKVVMPGMINSHMHLYSTFARGMDLKTDQPPRHFLEILEKLWWRLDNTLKADDIYYSALYAILTGIKQGTTTIIDHHASYGQIKYSLEIIAKAVEESGIRADLAYEISDRNGDQMRDAALKESEEFINNIAEDNSERLNTRIGLHASFTLEDDTLAKVSKLADKMNSNFHIHAAEGRLDLEHSRLKGYNGVVKRLDDYDIWRPGTIAVHGVHLQDEELEILKENECFLVHNPESNLNNAVGVTPLKKVLAKGVKLCLGTDGYTTDMFESIKFADLVLKHSSQDPGLGWTEIPEMVFKRNPELASQSFGVELGVLKKGAAADIIVVDYFPPTEINSDNSYAHILFGINGGMVDTTIVAGKILMEDREVKVFDYQKIAHESREQANDFWQRF